MVEGIALFDSVAEGARGKGCIAAVSASGAQICLIAADGIGSAELASRANAVIARLQAWGEQLALTVARDVGLPAFMEVAAKPLANPIALFSMDGTVLAIAGEFKGSTAGTVWERLGSGAIDWGYYPKRDMRRFHEGIGREPHLLFRPDADPSHEYLSSFVRVGDEIVASFGLVDINAPFTPGEVELVAHITEMLSIYLRGNDAYLRLARSSDAMLQALISGEGISRSALDLWLGDRGLGGAEGFAVAAVLPARPEDSEEAVFPRVARALDQMPRSLGYLHDGAYIVLCGLVGTDRTEAAKILQGRLAALLADTECVWGLSSLFGDISSLPSACEQARLSARFASEALDEGGEWASMQEEVDGSANDSLACMEFERCLPVLSLGAIEESLGIGVACDLRLMELSDTPSGRDLVESLYRYLLAGSNIAAAARELHIHRNTMIYRIGRICELLDVDEAALAANALYWLISCAILLSW